MIKIDASAKLFLSPAAKDILQGWLDDPEIRNELNQRGFDMISELSYQIPLYQRMEIYDYLAHVVPSIFDKCTYIHDYAFFSYENLKSIEVPYGVEYIGDYAFDHCIQLQQVVLPDSVTTIGLSAFARCHRLQHIQMPKTLEKIDRTAFYNCTSLESCIIPEGVTALPPQLFQGCTKLQAVKLPSTLSTTFGTLFEDIKYLRTVIYSNNLTVWTLCGKYGIQCKPASEFPG